MRLSKALCLLLTCINVFMGCNKLQEKYSEEVTMDLFTGLQKTQLIKEIKKVDVFFIQGNHGWLDNESLRDLSTRHEIISDNDKIAIFINELRYTDPGIKKHEAIPKGKELHLIFTYKNSKNAYIRVSWHDINGLWSVNLYAPIAYQIFSPVNLMNYLAINRGNSVSGRSSNQN
jgi:hypothetical protein